MSASFPWPAVPGSAAYDSGWLGRTNACRRDVRRGTRPAVPRCGRRRRRAGRAASLGRSTDLLDGEPHLSEYADGTRLPALEVAGGEAPARRELVGGAE